MAENLSHSLESGTRLEEYRIEKLLGEGGFGLTYLAFDVNLEKLVAIKEYLPIDFAVRGPDHSVHPRTSGTEEAFEWGRSAFITEARMLAKFHNPYIVQVYRYFEAHGTAYIVMEYIEGSTLKAMVKELGGLDQKEVMAILLPMMDGLAAVHEEGILHRDIKPDNILLRENGRPVLIDFGAARQALGSKSRSITTIITPGYAPIEQYSSKGDVGPWSDIYALAAVAYYCLTLNKPEDASDRVIDDQLESLTDYAAKKAERRGHHNLGTPGFLQAIDAALSVAPQNRPQNLETWAEQLKSQTQLPAAEITQPETESATPNDATKLVTETKTPARTSSATIAVGKKSNDDATSVRDVDKDNAAPDTRVIGTAATSDASGSTHSTGSTGSRGAENEQHRSPLMYILIGTVVLLIAVFVGFKFFKSEPVTGPDTVQESNRAPSQDGTASAEDTGTAQNESAETASVTSPDNTEVDASGPDEVAETDQPASENQGTAAQTATETTPLEIETPPQESARFPLFITTDPASAAIEVIGLGRPYQQGMELPAGYYQIKVSSPGYSPQQVSITIAEVEIRQHIELQPLVSAAEQQLYEQARQSKDIPTLERYIAEYPAGSYVTEVTEWLETARREAAAAQEQAQADQAAREQELERRWTGCDKLPGKASVITGRALFDIGSAEKFNLKLGRFPVRSNAITRITGGHPDKALCGSQYCYEIRGKFGLQDFTYEADSGFQQGKACFYYLDEKPHVYHMD